MGQVCVKAGGDYFEGDGVEVPDFLVEISESESEDDNTTDIDE